MICNCMSIFGPFCFFSSTGYTHLKQASRQAGKLIGLVIGGQSGIMQKSW